MGVQNAEISTSKTSSNDILQTQIKSDDLRADFLTLFSTFAVLGYCTLLSPPIAAHIYCDHFLTICVGVWYVGVLVQ